MLAEATTSEISKEKKPKSLDESKVIAKQGGTIAGNTRKEIEAKTGKKVVSALNAKQITEKHFKEKAQLVAQIIFHTNSRITNCYRKKIVLQVMGFAILRYRISPYTIMSAK